MALYGPANLAQSCPLSVADRKSFEPLSISAGAPLSGHHLGRWTKLPVISTWDDICRIWSKRASRTSIVGSLYRLAVVPFHLVQQLDRNVA
jgi:hypothetical protein